MTPRWDAICGGGLSLVVAGIVIVYGLISEAGMGQMLIAIEVYLLTDLLINGPHFMASYRLLYKDRENLRTHPIVSIGFPIAAAGFLGYLTYGAMTGPVSDPMGVMPILNLFAPILLGWHYVGQSWGNVACFSFLSGFRMSPITRRLIRGGMLTLFVYHVAWAYDSTQFVANLLPGNDAGKHLMQSVMSLCRQCAFVGFICGLIGFRILSKEQNRSIPVRMWLPWAATFSWYVMVDIHPASFFLLQAFHAFQYMMFPIRVELNEYTNPRHRWRHMILYYVILIVIGYVAFEWATLFDVPEEFLPVGVATMMVINMHHYFIDAVIWKIREPKVRNALFGHLPSGNA